MSFRSIPRKYLTVQTSSRQWTALTVASFLLICIFVGAPLLTVLFRAAPINIPEPEFIALVIVGLLFGIYLLRTRLLVTGFAVSLLVLVTVRVNIPLGPAEFMLGGIGANLWLVHLPVIGLLAYFVFQNGTVTEIANVHYLYGGFIAWTGITAIFGAGPRPVMAALFTLFVFQAGLVFILASWVVQTGLLSFRTALSVFMMAVLSHTAFGLLQFLNGDSFGGFEHLGEATRHPVETIVLGPLSYPIGPHINGLTFGGPLAVLITLSLPIAIVLAVRLNGWMRVLVGVGAISMAFIQRATAWDAARGGVLVAMAVLLTSVCLWLYRDLEATESINSRTVARHLLFGALVTAPVLIPGDRSGSSTSRPAAGIEGAKTAESGQAGSVDGAKTAESGQAGSVDGDGIVQTVLPPDTLNTLSVPLFDLSNFGIRLQQYVLGFLTFREYPLFGLGGANFYYVSNEIGLPGTYYMHNMYIALLAETGAPGFLLYMAAIAGTYYAGWKLLKERDTDSILVLGVLAGLTGVFAQLFFQPQMMRMPSMFSIWAVSGLLVGSQLRQT